MEKFFVIEEIKFYRIGYSWRCFFATSEKCDEWLYFLATIVTISDVGCFSSNFSSMCCPALPEWTTSSTAKTVTQKNSGSRPEEGQSLGLIPDPSPLKEMVSHINKSRVQLRGHPLMTSRNFWLIHLNLHLLLLGFNTYWHYKIRSLDRDVINGWPLDRELNIFVVAVVIDLLQSLQSNEYFGRNDIRNTVNAI